VGTPSLSAVACAYCNKAGEGPNRSYWVRTPDGHPSLRLTVDSPPGWGRRARRAGKIDDICPDCGKELQRGAIKPLKD